MNTPPLSLDQGADLVEALSTYHHLSPTVVAVATLKLSLNLHVSPDVLLLAALTDEGFRKFATQGWERLQPLSDVVLAIAEEVGATKH